MASLIDLPTHTSYSSPCGRMSASELVEAALQAGLHGVAVTEHLVIVGAPYAQELARRKYGFPIFCGVEANTTIFGDILVFGCLRDSESRIHWHLLQRVVLDGEGVLIPAHPFLIWYRSSPWYFLTEEHPPSSYRQAAKELIPSLTAIEVQNGACDTEENSIAAKLARALSLPGVGGSDPHLAGQVGRAVTWFPDTITTDAELVAALRQGNSRAINRKKQMR